MTSSVPVDEVLGTIQLTVKQFEAVMALLEDALDCGVFTSGPGPNVTCIMTSVEVQDLVSKLIMAEEIIDTKIKAPELAYLCRLCDRPTANKQGICSEYDDCWSSYQYGG